MTGLRRPAAPPAAGPLERLRFTALPGHQVAVCGLHGGAGTSTTAVAIAAEAARASGPGRVLLAETDPVGGGLADRLGHASPLGLAELARAMTRATPAPGRPFAQLPSGLRLCAARAAPRAAAPVQAAAELLRLSANTHPLTVTDCGTLREPHSLAGLTAADTIIWTVAADRLDLPWLRRRLAGPLTRPARAARWMLAVTPAGAPVAVRDLQQAAADLVAAVVLLPDAPRPADRSALAAELAAALHP